MSVLGLGSLLFALPHFIAGQYHVGKSLNLHFEACGDVNDFSPDCNEEPSKIYCVFIIGSIVIGIGAAPLYTIGTSYIEEIIHPKNTPICMGIFFTAALIGSALGFVLGGAFLTMHVDLQEDTVLEQSHPGYVGAWWLCFILFGVISILISILFFMFPEEYPNSGRIQRERVRLASDQRKKEVKEEDLNIRVNIKELPKHVANLLRRVPFLCVTLAASLQALVVSIIVSFAPKYVETQFGVTSSTASLISGAVGVTFSGLGIMLGMLFCIKSYYHYIHSNINFTGAVLTFYKRPLPKRLSLYFIIINIVAAVFLTAFFFRCPTHDIAGITISYPNR